MAQRVGRSNSNTSQEILEVGSRVFKDRAIIEQYKEIAEMELQSPRPESRENLLTLVDILLKRNLLNESLQVTEKVLEKEKQNVDFKVRKGQILQEMGDFAEAIAVFQDLIRKNPNNPRYHNLLGECYRLAGKKELAIKQFKKAIDCTSGDIVSVYDEFDARESLSFLYYEKEKYDEAKAQIMEVIKRNSRHPLWRLLFKILEKKGDNSALEKARADYKSAKAAEKHFLRGEDSMAKGNPAFALECYEKAKNIYPYEPEYYYAIGNIYLEERDFETAETFLRRAVDIFPENEKYLLSFTGCLMCLEKYEEAYQMATRGMYLSPLNFIDNFKMLSLKLDKMQFYEDTLKNIVTKDKSGRYPLIRFRLGQYYKENENSPEAKRWFKDAIRVLQKQIREYPGNWKNYSLLGDACRETGDLKKALAYYVLARKMINIKETASNALMLERRMAEIHTELQQYDKAIEIYQALTKIQPNESSYFRNLGINWALKGDLRKAERKLEKALGMDERNPETLYHIAIVNCALKNLGKSVKFLVNAILLDSTYLEKAKKEKALAPLFDNGLLNNIIKREELEDMFK